MIKPIKIYFIRHGETYYNLLSKMQGWSDTPLTQKGHEQAYLFGRKVKTLGSFASTIYCSDMNRSVQTAEEINQGLLDSGHSQLRIKKLPELREQFYGSFEGKSKSETYRLLNGTNLSDVLTMMTSNELQDELADLDPRGLAETSAQFWSRFSRGIKLLIEENTTEKAVLVVAHSAVLTALVDTYAPKMLTVAEPSNLSLTTVEFPQFGFNPKIMLYNQQV